MKGASPPLRISHSLNLVADWLVLFGAGSSSASGAVRNLAEAVGSPPPSTSTWRGLEASTKEKTWLSIGKVDFFMGKGEGEVAGNEDFYEVPMWWAQRWRQPTKS
jgi:hypothetical protein